GILPARGVPHNTRKCCNIPDNTQANTPGNIDDYNLAIKFNPNYADAYIRRGIVRDDLGDKPGAIDDYNQAIKINPKK
ncbi:MAG: tetratricopeptide repeat protein, partial [Dolichospermum sp.]